MSQNIPVIERLYSAFRSGDYEALEEICAANIEWNQNEGFPYGGIHYGHRNIVSGVFEKLASKWDGFGFDIDEMLETDDRVVVIGSYRGKHRETQRDFVAAAVHVFDLDHQKVTRFRQYTDTAIIKEAAGL